MSGQKRGIINANESRLVRVVSGRSRLALSYVGRCGNPNVWVVSKKLKNRLKKRAAIGSLVFPWSGFVAILVPFHKKLDLKHYDIQKSRLGQLG